MTPIVERWLAEQGLIVRREFRAPWGICDLVACAFDKTSVAKRIALKQTAPIGNPLRAAVLSAIPNESDQNGISAAGICKRLGNPSATTFIEREIRLLLKGRYIVETPSGSFKSRCTWTPLHRRLVAVELKLSRIADVVFQAKQNREFASESFIAIPELASRRVMCGPRKEELQQAGIGLIEVSDHCEVVMQPRSVCVSADMQLHLSDLMWRVATKGKAA